MKTHHQLLGISHHASAAQIRQAYLHAVEELDLAQQYASYDELKIRRLVLREAYEALSAPAHRQRSGSGQSTGRSARYQTRYCRAISRNIAWLLLIGILIAAVYVSAVYVVPGARQVTAAGPDRSETIPGAGLVQAPVPSAKSVHEAGRKAHMRRNRLAEKLHAQQMQREVMLHLSAQSVDELQQSGADNDANSARQNMRRLPE